MDLNLDDFASRVNSDLVGKIVNLASRGAQMLSKKMDGVMSTPDAEGLIVLEKIDAQAEQIAKFYDSRDFAKATTLVREMAELTNKYFDEKAPWKTVDSEPEKTKQVLTTTLNAFRKLAVFLKPVLPKMAEQVYQLLQEKSAAGQYVWSDYKTLLTNHKIADYVHLAGRVDQEKVKAMIEEQKKNYESTAKSKVTIPAPAKADKPAGPPSEIEFDDFDKVDLRIAEIIEAEEIKEADKLLRLKVSLGDGVTKQIISGIKMAYKPETLVGRKVLVCANLKPRKMKFGMSEGMVIAAGDGGSDLFLLSPDAGAKPGSRAK
jgi:methionyl-tRNA synthetase